MDVSDGRVGRAAFAAAGAGTVLAPLHALSRYATEDGAADLESGAVRAWAEPAAGALRPLLDWGDPQTVYTSFGRLWTPILVAAVACAVVVRRQRIPAGGERWGWRLLLTGLVGATAGTAGTYWTPWMDAFFVVTLPFALLSLLAALVLGVSLLRRRFRPRATAVLLVLWLPLFPVLAGTVALGAALLPVLWAWGLAGRSLVATAPGGVLTPER